MTTYESAHPQEVPASALSFSAQPVDAGTFGPQSRARQLWSGLFARDRLARITQHPDSVAVELELARLTEQRPAYIVFAHQAEHGVAAAMLIPKQSRIGRRAGLGWTLHGYRLAGDRTLGDQSPGMLRAMLLEIEKVLARAQASFLMLEDLEEQDPLRCAALGGVGGLKVHLPAAMQPHHRIDLAGPMPTTASPVERAQSGASPGEAYWQSNFSAKARYNLRRGVKQFGNGRLERITSANQVAQFLAHAHEVASQSWQTEWLGLRVRNDERERQLLTALASKGALRSYLLWLDDVPVSFCFGTQYNGVFMYEEIAYDRRYAQKSPGQVLVVQLLDDLFAHDTPLEFDFGLGDAEYKRKFATRVSLSGPLWLLPAGWKSSCLLAFFKAQAFIAQRLRKTLLKSGWLPWLKRKLKRTG